MMIRAAGNLDAVKVDSKAFNDFVSDVDRSSEMILVEALKEAIRITKSLAKKAAPTVKPLPSTNGLSIRSTAQPTSSTAILNTPSLWHSCTKACCKKLWCTHLSATTCTWHPAAKGALLNDRRIPRFQPHRIEPLPDRYRLSCCRSKHDGQVSGDFERFLGKNRRRPS